MMHFLPWARSKLYVLYRHHPELVEKLLTTVSPRAEKIIRMKLGIREQQQSLKDIAAKFGVSEERIRQLERKAYRIIFFNLKKEAPNGKEK